LYKKPISKKNFNKLTKNSKYECDIIKGEELDEKTSLAECSDDNEDDEEKELRELFAFTNKKTIKSPGT
jgi:hypothetical protein